MTEETEQDFLKACYKAGVEWADEAHKSSPRLKLEDGLKEEFWNSPEADDYVVLYDVGQKFDIDFFNAVHTLKSEAARSLYKGCMDRWGEIFGKEKVRTVSAVIEKPVVPPPPQTPTPPVSPNRVFYSGTKIILNRKTP